MFFIIMPGEHIWKRTCQGLRGCEGRGLVHVEAGVAGGQARVVVVAALVVVELDIKIGQLRILDPRTSPFGVCLGKDYLS